MRIPLLPFFGLLIAISAYTDTSNRVIATIGVGDTPAGIAITPDGRYAYVANNNDDGITGGDSVSVIDLSTNTVIATIAIPPAAGPTFAEPYTVTINAAGTKAYVTNSNILSVTIIDIATNTISGTITGFDGPSGMVITPDGKTAYVNNYGGAVTLGGSGSGNGTTVSVVDLSSPTPAIMNTITLGLAPVAPAALAITPDGAYVYVANYVDGNPGTGTVSIIQTSNNTVVGTIPGFSGPFWIVISADGKRAYVTNFGSNNFSPVGNTVSVIDLTTNQVIDAITVGTQPSGLAITPDGRFAYVTIYNTLYLGPNYTDLTPGVGTVVIIDLCTNTVLCPVIVVGSSPAEVAITPDGTRAYVTNYSSNNVSAVNIVDTMWLNVCS